MRLKSAVIAGAIGGLLVVTGCTSTDVSSPTSPVSPPRSGVMDHSMMDHPSDGGEAPAGMQPAVDPKYPVGTEVTLNADHMQGMQGTKAKIVGAYRTYTYSVSYVPTTGGDRVTDHKWVVQQEIKDAGARRLPDGTEVTLVADHMKGMNGAKATIDSSTAETVYMVDFEAHGMTMKNHKWVVESEISPQT
ncbi:YdhK family protein [Gordonia iterans]